MADESEKAERERLAKIKESAEKEKNDLRDKLAGLGQTEAQAQQEMLDQYQQFLDARLSAELAAGNDARTFLDDQYAYILENTELNEEQRTALEASFAKARENLRREELSASAGFFGAMSNLLDAAAKDSREAAIAGKALSAAQAAINSYLAFTQALTSAPWPVNMVAAATVVAAGLAQQIKIWSTPIPSAETGGRFEVPDYGRVDSRFIRVNPGEQVDVTPRGETGTGTAGITNVILDGETFVSFINKKLRSGEIYEVSPAWNI